MPKDNKYSFVVNLAIETAIPAGTEVKISKASTVAQAAAGDLCIGVLIQKPDRVPGNAAIRTYFNAQERVIFGETIAAGDMLKIGTAGTGGAQRYIKFTPGTDAHHLWRGVSLVAGSENGTGEILRS
jgi:hypothetical protein